MNIVSEEFADRMNLTAAEVAPEVDEFELSGLTPVGSELVRPPRVGESHAHMECHLRQLLSIGKAPGGGTVVFGDVLRFHVDEEIVNGYKIEHDKLHAIGRMGGRNYVRTRDLFVMARPKRRVCHEAVHRSEQCKTPVSVIAAAPRGMLRSG